MIKKLLISSTLLSFLGLVTSATSAWAVDVCPGGQFDPLCKLDATNNTGLIGNVFNILLVSAVFLSIGFLIFGGIKWITSSGDKGKLDAARGTVTAAIVGLIISFMAFFIIGIVSYVFGLPTDGGPSLELPKLNTTN